MMTGDQLIEYVRDLIHESDPDYYDAQKQLV